MITTKNHNRIIEHKDKTINRIIEHKDKTINDYLQKILKLEQELKEARDLHKILDKFSSLTIGGTGFAVSGGNWSNELVLPDTMDINKLMEIEGFKSIARSRNSRTYTVKLHGKRRETPKGHGYEKDIKVKGATPQEAVDALTTKE